MSSIFMHLALVGDTWVIGLLILASVASIGVMIERMMVFSKNKGDLSKLMDGLAGLKSFSKGPAAVEEVMVSHWLREKLELERYLIILGTLGNNAPFVGLF